MKNSAPWAKLELSTVVKKSTRYCDDNSCQNSDDSDEISSSRNTWICNSNMLTTTFRSDCCRKQVDLQMDRNDTVVIDVKV